MGNCFGNKPYKSNGGGGGGGGGGAYSSGSLDLSEYPEKNIRLANERRQTRTRAELARQVDLSQIHLDQNKLVGSTATSGQQSNRYVTGSTTAVGGANGGGRGSRSNSHSNSRMNGVVYQGNEIVNGVNLDEPQSSCNRSCVILFSCCFSIRFR